MSQLESLDKAFKQLNLNGNKLSRNQFSSLLQLAGIRLSDEQAFVYTKHISYNSHFALKTK